MAFPTFQASRYLGLMPLWQLVCVACCSVGPAALWSLLHSGVPANISIKLAFFRSVIWATFDTAYRFCSVGFLMKWQDLLQVNFGFSYSIPHGTEEVGYGLGSGTSLCLPGICWSINLSSTSVLHGNGIIYDSVFKEDI